jgi:hypothetical protein
LGGKASPTYCLGTLLGLIQDKREKEKKKKEVRFHRLSLVYFALGIPGRYADFSFVFFFCVFTN